MKSRKFSTENKNFMAPGPDKLRHFGTYSNFQFRFVRMVYSIEIDAHRVDCLDSFLALEKVEFLEDGAWHLQHGEIDGRGSDLE